MTQTRARHGRAGRFPKPARALVVNVGLAGLLAGCSLLPASWFGPPDPVIPAWDSVSPPILVRADSFTDPDPIPMGLPPASGRYEYDGTDVVHYDVELVIPPENDRVSSRTTIRYLREERGPHRLTLDFTGLTVELVTDRGQPLDFTHENGLLRIDAPGRVGIYDTAQVEVMARGTPDDGLILGDNVHESPAAFADNWPNRARFWFPSKDHLSDKATVGFTVHAPEGREVVANGRQIGEPVPADSTRTGGIGGLVTWRWESSVPIPTYLMVVGVADLEVLDQGLAACEEAPASVRPDGCIEITGWAFAPDTAHAREVFSRTAEMVDLYVDLFGPFPFEKLANVQSSTRFGGMENASAIFYSESAIAQGRDIEGTVAHEVVHQWFGNSVTPADWSHLWLSEGFASYFGPFFWAQTEGDAAFRQRMGEIRASYLRSDAVGRPVVDTGVDNLLELLNANSYQKGALVLHMLRNVMGERAFWVAIRDYYRQHAGGHATTREFQAVMEAAHGQSLQWFFDQWLYQPGYPVLAVDWRWNDNIDQAQLTIVQRQDPRWPTFRFPIEFEFVTEGGVHRAREWIDGRTWRRDIPLPGPPSELRLDPDGWLLMDVTELEFN